MHHLFTYGTLQLPEVQSALFGRLLKGHPDILVGYKQVPLTINDPTVVGLSKKNTHVILEHTGNPKDQVSGVVYEISDKELLVADGYEPDDYRRVLVGFASGVEGWVYVR